MMTPEAPWFIRRITTLLMLGDDSEFILADLDETFAEDLARGMSHRQARQRYRVNALRSVFNTWIEGMRVPDVGVSSLDAKLGLRMLLKSPGLTVVTIFTLGIGIPASLVPLQATRMLQSDLPFDEGDRIVGLQNRDISRARPERRLIHDLTLWRETLSSVDLISAVRFVEYNVGTGNEGGSPVRGAEMTASAFAVFRVPPLLGRTFHPEDEVPGAPAVAIISRDLWQSRFAAEENIVGSTLSIGGIPHTVVGVMPSGFFFPMREHLWLPLRTNPLEYERGGGPYLGVFGRLAEGFDLGQAGAELETLGHRVSVDWAESHAQLRPEVDRYMDMMLGMSDISMRDFYLTQLITFLLLAVACGSVGTLFFARTANRAGELAVRTALGASRMRVVGQLFVEALLIALIAVSFGLVLTDFIAPRFMTWLMTELGESLPFWIDTGVNRDLMMLSLPVAVVAAVLAGVLPALRLTRKGVLDGLQKSGSGATIRFGAAATILIITQIALAVGLLSVSVGAGLGAQAARSDHEGLGITPERYLYATLEIPRDSPTSEEDSDGDYMEGLLERMRGVRTELDRRLSAEPGVLGVVWALDLPAGYHRRREIEVEGRAFDGLGQPPRIRRASVDVDFFKGLRAPILRGRGFDMADAENEGRVVIVNTNFVGRVLGGREPIGQRIRYRGQSEQEDAAWFEIVGVVGSLGMDLNDPGADEGVYHLLRPGQTRSIDVAIELVGEPGAFTQRLRELTAQIDPTALIKRPRPLEKVLHAAFFDARMGGLTAGLVSLISIVLSAAGLYAMVSFTVAQRTREIGIRSALGAGSVRILATIFRRTFLQLLAGIAAGVAFAAGFVATIFGASEKAGVNWFFTVGGIALLMMLIGLLACLRPALRGVRIQPTEALK